MDNMAAAVDEAALTRFITQHCAQQKCASPSTSFYTLKQSFDGFRKWRYADIKAWFRARPARYTIIGQLVVPHGMIAEAGGSGPALGDALSVHAALASARAAPTVPGPVPAAVLAALTNPAPGARVSLYCSICHIRCTSETNMRAHLKGARHHTALASADAHQLEEAVMKTTQDPAASGCHHCELCGKWFTRPQLFTDHVDSAAHRVRVFWLLLRSSPAGSDPPPASASDPRVTVSELPHPLPSVAPGGTATHTLTITNHGPGSVKLRSVNFLTPPADRSMRLEEAKAAAAPRGQLVWLPEGSSYEVRLVLEPTAMGLMRNLIVFDFGRATVLARPVAGVCCPPDMPPPPPPEPPATVQAQQRRRRGLVPVNEDVVRGVPPPGYTESTPATLPVRPLPPPGDLRRAVAGADWEWLGRRIPPLGEATSLKQYAERLQSLLWLEELQHEIDVRVYDMKEATLERAGRTNLLELSVPGLAENRPSVLKGDRLLVAPSDGSAGRREYEGYVHAVEKETVRLCFSDSFLADCVWVRGRKFNVRFTVNRSAFNLMQNALLRAQDPRQLSPHLVLPGTVAAPLPARLPPGLPLLEPAGGDVLLGPGGAPRGPLYWQDKALNDEQRLAVREVVRGAHAPLPYLIYGPPGTGKTSTLVEAAKQLLLTNNSSRLLLVAPSNSAADQLIQRMSSSDKQMTQQMGPGGCLLMRLCAYSRPLHDLPPDLRNMATSYGLVPWAAGGGGVGGGRVCSVNWDDQRGSFLLPPRDMIVNPRVRVVVTTCSMAARLVHAGVPPGHFSHVLLDEAGHAEEPLQMCALAGLAGPGSRVVMAGDPKQLGPIILSLFAKTHGSLDVSLMERLLSLPCGLYGGRDGHSQGARAARAGVQLPLAPLPAYPSTYITKLLTNYRSHPAILKVPNAAFYHDQLRTGALMDVVNDMLLWDGLPSNRIPMLLHHIVGKDEQEANSPSWQNLLEARQVVEYVNKLLGARRCRRVEASHIGIISPYKKQVQRIRVLLKELAQHIKVGSVEEFQGQERRIIIISTVRSSDEYLQFDSRHRLGFLANPKRFNVALTRAKALVVVVGNAQILVQDPYWRALLRHLWPFGAIIGQALPAKVADRLGRPPELDRDDDDEDEEEGGTWGAAGARRRDPSGEDADLADMLQRLVLRSTGHEVQEPGPEEYAAMMTVGAVVQVEGGEMRRFD